MVGGLLRLQDVELALDQVLPGEGLLPERLSALGATAQGYKEVWERILARLEEQQAANELRDALTKRVGDARKVLMKLGLVMETPLERALKKAYAVEEGATPENGDLVAFLQQRYDQVGNAAHVLRELIAILHRQLSNPEISEPERAELAYLIEALEGVNPTDAAKRLAYRGVVIDAARGAAVGRLKPGDSIQGQKAREAGLRKRARLSMMKLEALRMVEAEARKYPYAGRRSDIRDAGGHHPFITSLAAANYARHLMQAGEAWRYGSQALFIEVAPGFEDAFPKPYVYLEPDFVVYDRRGAPEEWIILADGNRTQRSAHGNSWEELETLQRMRPDLNLTIVNENDHYRGRETLPRNGESGVTLHSEQGLALQGECPCPLCGGSRVHEAFEPMPRGWRIGGRRR